MVTSSRQPLVSDVRVIWTDGEQFALHDVQSKMDTGLSRRANAEQCCMHEADVHSLPVTRRSWFPFLASPIVKLMNRDAQVWSCH